MTRKRPPPRLEEILAHRRVAGPARFLAMLYLAARSPSLVHAAIWLGAARR